MTEVEAKIITFPAHRAAKRPVAQRQFEALEEDLERRKTIAGLMARFFKAESGVALSRPARILLSRRRDEAGVVIPRRTDRDNFDLIVSDNIAPWLIVNAGLDPREADELASNYVAAFGAIFGRLGKATARTNGSFAPKLWPPDFQHSQAALPRLPYRAAAFVALEACTLDPLTFTDQPCGPHLASLANPFTISDFRELHPCFTIKTGEQGEF